MLGIPRASRAVAESADAVRDFANTAEDELSELSDQLRTATQYAPYIIVGIGVVAVVALVLSIVAVCRD